MKNRADAVSVFNRARTWLSDHGKDLFLASMQCLIGGSLALTIIVGSWQAGSFPPKRPDGTIDVLIAGSILLWSVIALIAGVGIMFRKQWAWRLEVVVAAVPFVIQIYLFSRIEKGDLVTWSDWNQAWRAVAFTGGILYLLVYALRKGLPKNGNNNPGVLRDR
jgi:hypothetical protein